MLAWNHNKDATVKVYPDAIVKVDNRDFSLIISNEPPLLSFRRSRSLCISSGPLLGATAPITTRSLRRLRNLSSATQISQSSGFSFGYCSNTFNEVSVLIQCDGLLRNDRREVSVLIQCDGLLRNDRREVSVLIQCDGLLRNDRREVSVLIYGDMLHFFNASVTFVQRFKMTNT